MHKVQRVRRVASRVLMSNDLSAVSSEATARALNSAGAVSFASENLKFNLSKDTEILNLSLYEKHSIIVIIFIINYLIFINIDKASLYSDKFSIQMLIFLSLYIKHLPIVINFYSNAYIFITIYKSLFYNDKNI